MKIHHKAFRARKWRPKSNAVASSQLSHMHVAWAVVNFMRFSNFYSVILVHTRKALGVWLLGWHMYLFCSLGYSWIRALTHSMHSAVSIYCWIIQKVTKQKKMAEVLLFSFLFRFVAALMLYARERREVLFRDCEVCYSGRIWDENTEKALEENHRIASHKMAARIFYTRLGHLWMTRTMNMHFA